MVAVWSEASVEELGFTELRQSVTTDVVVIGGGITGLTTALQLAEQGRDVVVLEADRVGQSNTGNSTGNLYSTVAKGLEPIRRKWGDEVVRDLVRARASAVDHMESLNDRLGMDCQFARMPLYRVQLNDDPKRTRSLEQEVDALRAAGLAPQEVSGSLFGLTIKHGLKLDNQAQLNPLRFTQELARAATVAGAQIYENSGVVEISYRENRVKTASAEVHASHIVHATHTPKGIDVLQTGMMPSREYGVSAQVRPGTETPEGVVWVIDAFHSLRSYHYNGNDYVMVVGEDHKGGEGTHGKGYFDKLEQYLSAHYDIGPVRHRWSAQQFSSPDGLPFIGRMHGKDNAYVATGFAADGLVWGTLAGLILCDMITDRPNEWGKLFDARRFTPVKSLKGVAEEGAKVTKDLVKDYLSPDRVKDLDKVEPGEGRVLTHEGEKLAVYRDPSGTCTAVSAICPHMKCVVHFNGADTSWDCPCHGSRFRIDGSVIEGPALSGLTPKLGARDTGFSSSEHTE